MPRVRLTVDCNIPARGYCNSSVRGLTPSKQLCKFCKKQSDGFYCILHEVYLKTEGPFVYQYDDCWDAAISGQGSVVSDPLQIDPLQVARELIKQYDTTVKQLIAQGYPRNIAEQAAMQDVLGGGK